MKSCGRPSEVIGDMGLSENLHVTGRPQGKKTKQDFLDEAIQAKLYGNAACGCGDPYPHDVKARTCFEAFYALGGTNAEALAAWDEVYASTPHSRGGGA